MPTQKQTNQYSTSTTVVIFYYYICNKIASFIALKGSVQALITSSYRKVYKILTVDDGQER
jgi:hypothetical protein